MNSDVSLFEMNSEKMRNEDDNNKDGDDSKVIDVTPRGSAISDEDSTIGNENDDLLQRYSPGRDVHVRRFREQEDDQQRYEEYLKQSVSQIYFQRIGWLIALLLLQSFSSFILASFEKLLSEHIIITLFLTMLVGSGGNAGSQSTVIVVRGIATGDIPRSRIAQVLWKEFRVGLILSGSLGLVGFFRVWMYRLIHPLVPPSDLILTQELFAISLSLACIVLVSVIIGTLFPLFLHFVMGLDSANAGPSVQVVMDIVGVLITCIICQIVLPSSRKI
jgi:Mg/Co/Ni transporter MgtE